MLLQEIAKEYGRPTPALYLLLASSSLLKSACALLLRTPTGQHSCSNSSLLDTQLLTLQNSVGATCVPPDVSSCSLERGKAISSAVIGQQLADGCSQQLQRLMQDYADLEVSGLSTAHYKQWHRLSCLSQHHHHSDQHDIRSLLLSGRSPFSLYPAEPSRKAWLCLLQHLQAPEELSTASAAHNLLLPRGLAGSSVRPQSVYRRVTVQHL